MQTEIQNISEVMEKISENTEFDFYYSPTAELERGNGCYVNGQAYSEKIIKGKPPVLGIHYTDLKKVFTGNSHQYALEFKHK